MTNTYKHRSTQFHNFCYSEPTNMKMTKQQNNMML